MLLKLTKAFFIEMFTSGLPTIKRSAKFAWIINWNDPRDTSNIGYLRTDIQSYEHMAQSLLNKHRIGMLQQSPADIKRDDCYLISNELWICHRQKCMPSWTTMQSEMMNGMRVKCDSRFRCYGCIILLLCIIAPTWCFERKKVFRTISTSSSWFTLNGFLSALLVVTFNHFA